MANKALDPYTLINAFTNNTFKLDSVEKQIEDTVHHSFSYLTKLQLAYMDIGRFHFTQEDLYENRNGLLEVNVPKDFIDDVNRKAYRKSEFYTKEISMDSIISNPDIFSFFPIVMVDNEFIVDYRVRCALTGDTEIILPVFGSSDYEVTHAKATEHSIDVIFYKDTSVHKFTINKNIMKKYEWYIPPSISGITMPENTQAFISLKDTTHDVGTFLYPVTFDSDGYIFVNNSNDNIVSYIEENRDIEVYLIIPESIYGLSYNKPVLTRIDTKKNGAFFTIFGEDGQLRDMPVPVQNITLFRVNRETEEYELDNTSGIVQYYPNIYWINTGEEVDDGYYYKVFYHYYGDEATLNHINELRHVFRELNAIFGLDLEAIIGLMLFNVYLVHNVAEDDMDERKGDIDERISGIQSTLGSMTGLAEYGNSVIDVLRVIIAHLNEMQFDTNDDGQLQVIYDSEATQRRIEELLRETLTPGGVVPGVKDNPTALPSAEALSAVKRLREFFLGLFEYVPTGVEYNYVDYVSSGTFDFDYKIGKLKDLISQAPLTLQSYGKAVSNPFESYYLNVKSLNLALRWRETSSPDVSDDVNNIYFDQPRYMFMFYNETSSDLELRFFVDGLLVTDVVTIHEGDHEYFYIPVSIVKEDSFIEVEKFNEYKAKYAVTFENTTSYQRLVFENKNPDVVRPTLYDLIIRDANGNMVSRKNFDIKVERNNTIYNVSEGISTSDESQMGYFIKYNYDEHTYEYDLSGDRLPVKYTDLDNLQIRCINSELLNQPIYFIVEKCSSLHVIENAGNKAEIALINGTGSWEWRRSYIRIFVNGRFNDRVDYTVTTKNNKTYIQLDSVLEDTDELTVDITPYSYELEYKRDNIPSNGLLELNLSKPLDLSYYDVYLNGRKLTDNNIKLITPTKVQFFNIHSFSNLLIYRKDRDFEFFSKGVTYQQSLVDKVLASKAFTQEEKNQMIYSIIYDTHSAGKIIIPPTIEDPEEPMVNPESRMMDKNIIVLRDAIGDTSQLASVLGANSVEGMIERLLNRLNEFSFDWNKDAGSVDISYPDEE